MVPIRSGLAAALALTGLALVAGTATPTPAAVSHSAARSAVATADAQLISALRIRMSAARALESATLVAVDQRLRAIYASPIEDPLTTLLTGDITGAEALSEITAAMAQSDRSLLFGFTNAVANLQTAQTELADNMLRATASARIAAARRAAQDGPTSFVTIPVGTHATPVSSANSGLPSAVVRLQTLPGTAPINPHTGRPYPVTWTGP